MKKTQDSGFPKPQMPGLSIMDLPSPVFLEIVLKSTVKSVIMCKSVCKTWWALISDPQFAKRYSSQSKTLTLIRDTFPSNIARSLYLFEPEHGREFEDMYCLCTPINDNDSAETEMKTKLKIPFRNFEAMLDRVNNDGETGTRFISVGPADKKNENLIMLRPSEDPGYVVSNSCNGLLCLSKSEFEVGDRRAVVCNPVTGEFVYLPEPPGYGRDGVLFSDCAFGFSPKHNQYKVVRMSTTWTNNPVTGTEGYYASMVGIHTVGTDLLWRSIDTSGFVLQYEERPSYLNGSIYWISKKDDDSSFLARFDLDEEKFEAHYVPSLPRQDGELFRSRKDVVDGRLYLHNTEAEARVDIWVMNGCGTSLSWTPLFSIDISKIHDADNWFPYRIVCCLNGKALVLFGGPRNEFIYCDQTGGLRFKQLEFQGRGYSKFEVINFTPSFISLNDIVMQGNIEVLNVNSDFGCEKLKLLEETYPLVLGIARN